jgi:DeoR/GlpR family transcriptional regulator of sugar metabolism
MPSSPEEKGIWSAFSASSFKNALEIYDENKYPYEFAMTSHNYATALMNFPPAKIHDNLAKANGLFQGALKIRTAEQYPFERALTLLNQVELFWLSHNENTEAEDVKYKTMVSKVNEVKALVTDKNLQQQAENHLMRLEELKTIINK